VTQIQTRKVTELSASNCVSYVSSLGAKVSTAFGDFIFVCQRKCMSKTRVLGRRTEIS